MATEKVLIEIQTSLNESAEQLKKVTEELNAIKEGQEEIQENSKDTAKGLKGIGMAFKGVGTAMKAMGIGLIIKAFDLLSEILMENQIAVDAFSTAFEFASILVSDFINWITENSGTVTEFFKSIFEDPQQAIKDFGNAIKDNIMERIESFLDMLGYLSSAIKSVFEGDWDAAMENAKKAGKEFVDVQTGVNDSWDKGAELLGDVTDKVIDYTTETFKAAQAQTELNKAAELAEVRNQGLIEFYDRQAEKLRQTRDDETQTMEARVKANDDLLILLKKQETAMLANANLRLEQAQKKKALDETNHQALIEEQQALNEIAAIKAQITGFESEQMSNAIALQREQADIEQEILDEKREANEEYWAAITEKMEDAVDAENKKREEAAALEAQRREANFAAVDMGFQAMNMLFEENAKMQKAIAVAETIWNTAKAIMAQMTLPMPAGAIMAGFAAAMGAIQIANILSTDVEGGGGSVPAVPSAPAVNTSVNALETSPNAQIAGLGEQQPSRAFVVSSDVTTQQSLDRRILQNATFG